MTWKVKMEDNLKRNFNLISLQHRALNFAAISLDDRWPLWCPIGAHMILRQLKNMSILNTVYSMVGQSVFNIITRTRQHGKMCKTNHSICIRISVIIALHTLQKYRNQDFIWINFMKWYESWELHECAGRG